MFIFTKEDDVLQLLISCDVTAGINLKRIVSNLFLTIKYCQGNSVEI